MRAARVLIVSVVLALAGPAVADDAFHPVPDSGGLELRVVRYGKRVHGEMRVEVRNPTGAPLTFTASGLYFVPDDTYAAQRLGVAGRMRAGSEGARSSQVALGPGQVRSVSLDVFCIDEHREAPSADQAFTLARSRMPARLSAAIEARTLATQARSGPLSTEQEQLMQGQVWDARRTVRFRLQGERR